LKSAGLEINCTKVAEMKRTTKPLIRDKYIIKSYWMFR